MECISDKNKGRFNCTYEPCPRKYKCCECVRYHGKNGELPACFFNSDYEKTYDRSIGNFIEMHQR